MLVIKLQQECTGVEFNQVDIHLSSLKLHPSVKFQTPWYPAMPLMRVPGQPHLLRLKNIAIYDYK
jgi:hypothetical protein